MLEKGVKNSFISISPYKSKVNTHVGTIIITELTGVVLLLCARSGPHALEELSYFVFTAPWSRYKHLGSPFTCEGTDALPGYVYMLEATHLERGAGLGSQQSDSPTCLSHCPIQAVLTGKSLEEYSEFLTAILLRDIDLLTILTCSLFSLFTYSCPQPSYL